MKKKVRNVRLSTKKKTTKKTTPKIKNTTKKVGKKSYYKPKKKVVALPEPVQEAIVELVPTTVVVEPAPVKVSKRPVKYLNNRDLLIQVLLSKKQDDMTSELAKMLQLLTSRYAKKGNFANYTYNDDMQSYAMLMIVKTWRGFDPAKSSNPFAWFTQCIKNSFIQYLNYEKRQRDVRDEVLVNSGLNPSFGYAYDYEEKQASGEAADQEVMEAPTKLHEDVETFHEEPDTTGDEQTVPQEQQ